jgi:hypothetical protein
MTNWAQVLFNSAVTGSLYLLSAVALTLTYGLSRFPNFAHAEFMALGAYAGYFVSSQLHLPFVVCILFAFLATGILGLISYKGIFGPLSRRGSSLIHLMIASMALGFIARYFIAEIWGWAPLSFSIVWPGYDIGPVRISAVWLLPIVTALLAGVSMHMVLTRTKIGKATIVATVQYDLTKLDYLTELQTIKDKAPDCVIHVGYGDDAKIVYKQALQLGLSNAQWIAPEGVYADATLSVPETAQFMASSVIGTRPTAPEGLAAFATFATAYKAAFNIDPGVYCDGAYDAANLAFAAMKNVGTTDGTKIAAEVLKLAKNYAGASGSITMNSYGDRVSGDYEVWKVVKSGSTYSYAKVKIIKL